MNPRELTHDEKKAAEAAFRGLPLDPTWSSSARSVYQKLVQALPSASGPLLKELSQGATSDVAELEEFSKGEVDPAIEPGISPNSRLDASAVSDPDGTYSPSRDDPIYTGRLIDVTPLAQDLGISLPVALSRSLWDFGITVCETVPDDQYIDRVRDLIMALRLHLSGCTVVAQIIQFPVLLSFPPNPVPEVCTICARVQAEVGNRPFLTLLLPSEVRDQTPPLSS